MIRWLKKLQPTVVAHKCILVANMVNGDTYLFFEMELWLNFSTLFESVKKCWLEHIFFLQTFQFRAYVYQARSLIGSDASGLSDPFARVIIGENMRVTQVSISSKLCKIIQQVCNVSLNQQVIDETLSPTWDELLIVDNILLYGTQEDIKKDPPAIVIEIFDQDKVVSKLKL